MDSEWTRNTPICERLGIKYPIFQAGMGFVAHAEVAAAVSKAIGLGCLGSGSMSSHELKEQISRCRDLTDRPFGVDILFAEIEADKADSTVVKYSSNVQRLIDLTFEAKIPVIVSGLGNPAGIIEQAHKNGVVVLSLCGNVKQARRLEASGVDVIIAQGHEAGGHRGRVGTMALVPEVVDAVRVPVLAAWCATSSPIHGSGARPRSRPFPLQSMNYGFPLAGKARYEGKVEEDGLACGQSAALIDSIQSAGQIVHDVMDEARMVVEQRFANRGAAASSKAA